MRQSTSSASHRTLSILIEKLAVWLLSLSLFLICIALFLLGPLLLPAYKDAFISISTSLLASLVFALLYSFIVERHHQRSMNIELEHVVQQALKQAIQLEQGHLDQILQRTAAKMEELEQSHYHQIAQHFDELIPHSSFPSTNTPDKAFNDLLAQELKQSQEYWFKGSTGRYIASRLIFARRTNLNSHVLLVDPTHKELLSLYVKDRFGPAISPVEMDQRIEQVRREIYMTIVDLYDVARLTHTVELKLYSGPVFYRTEILDAFLLISYFTADPTVPSSKPTAYPKTYLYERDSFYYKIYMADFQQTFELAEHAIVLRARTTEQELDAFLRKLGCDPALIPKLRREARAFREAFFAQVAWHIEP